MPITAEQAWDATDPSQTTEQRTASAQAVIQGVAANDAYLASRGEIERLTILSTAPQVVAHADLNDQQGEVPTGSGPQTVEGTVVDDSHSLGTGVTGSQAPSESGSPGADPVAVLRKQLEDAGINPAA